VTRQGHRIGADTVADVATRRRGRQGGAPYGIYDLAADTGRVNVGTDHDTAASPVESIRRGWNARGRADYPRTWRLLITRGCGRGRQLTHPRLEDGPALAPADRPGDHRMPPPTLYLQVEQVEHRLFSHITMNWRDDRCPATRSMSISCVLFSGVIGFSFHRE
jgi:hypothetical protein